ncbi:hypothetical protein GQ457_18G015440 [Hibiscus cannabinus]
MGTNPQSKSQHPNSISSLYEVEYTEDQKIQPTTLPTVNPYLAYQKPSSSIIKSIKSLIHKAPKSVKEYVQSSSFDKFYISGAAKEQFVTLEIPSTFPKGWIEAGYSHIHFGAIRLALNYHGAEGKPIIARIALLDTRFLKYQDACIGTVEATMNNGLVMVTLFPDFTMALVDPNLMDALKVQIHIIGAPQVESSIIATLHYQIVYRVQDHSFKLSKGGPTESPLPLITVNTQEQPHCIGIPRKISRDELIQLLPESWVTSYEQTHATRQPVRSTETKITSKSDGTSEIKFDHSHLKEQQTPPIFHTQIMMMLPRGDPTAQHDKENPKDCWCDLCHPGAESRMIEKWDAEGKPILFWKDPVTGHCPWNEDCSCKQCVEFTLDQELEGSRHTSYKPHKRRSKKKNSIDDEPTEDSIFAIQSLDEVPDDSTSNSELSSSDAFMLQARVSPSDSDKLTIPTPHIPVSVYCEKYDKAIEAIAFIDTGAGKTIMNPDILPETWWKPYTKKFSTASNEIFTTYLISKPITIQFFPGCSIRTTVLGSRLPGKDILLGFDIFNQSLIEDLKARSCAESHEDFLSKCDHPLWQNPEFYVKLPFKKNEDINPTKASHAGMNPEHQKLAIAECSELLQQGLIEPSDSQWACEAFYVNKRSEQARGKLRLVINYQTLNHFLQDDKFPLPNRNALFSSLSKAQIFSKFDLKAGFWQLGIDPTDRPKTGFCIPNQHYQWKVMPFGLKTAPSLFQKAMIRIFQPIMDQALIYIDDILLFSQDEEAHLKLLQRFSQLLVQYGIMLSERKMKINQKEIEFLGMNLKEGKYQPGPHIAQELIKFPEKDLSKKQILQFLGIVNYLRDFIPKISKYTNPLRKMLKKDPPQWSDTQTKAVKILKDKLQQLPPLKIPSDGKRVLQTDASDKYWGAILFEEKDKKRQLCGYKSGRFTDAEIHYHSTFKEILAVKRAIAKFEYHLIGHHFLVEMDMSSFPQMLKFKQKTVPHPQLLRWSEWFSKYSFDCRHIKGKTNVLADLLTRPKQNKGQIMMLRPSSSKDKVPKKRQKENPETAFDIPPNLNPEFPPEVYRLVMENRFHAKARDMIFEYQLDIFRDYGGLMLNPLGLHPDYPFIHPIHFEVEEVPDEVKWLLWYLTHIHQIAIQFVLPDLQYFVDEAIQGTEPAICRNLGTILKWFFPLPHWKDLIKQAVEQDQGHFIIIILYKPQYFIQHGNAKQLGTFPSAHVHSVQWEDIRKREDRSIMEAQQQYKDNIPDPSEWSQDYPWYDSNASKMTKEDDYMETEEGNDSTSTDSAQLPFSNRN